MTTSDDFSAGLSTNRWIELLTLVAVTLLGLLAVFQLILAMGLPLGRAAWGGKHRVLPAKLRWGSAAAIPVLALAGWAVLARTGFVPPGPESLLVKILVWFFAGYFTLNTVGNIASKSRVERNTMTPVSTLLVICFVVAALS